MPLLNKQRMRTVAIIDVIKAISILAVGVGLLRAQSHVLEHGGDALLAFLDISRTYSAAQRFLEFLHAADMQHGLIFVLSCAYAALRLFEAYGLWRQRQWARWLGLISAGIYVPFELYYLAVKPSWTALAVLIVNLLVLCLLWPRKSLTIGPGNTPDILN